MGKPRGGYKNRRRQARQESASVRQAWSDQLSIHEKIRRAKKSIFSKKKEIARLSKQLNTQQTESKGE